MILNASLGTVKANIDICSQTIISHRKCDQAKLVCIGCSLLMHMTEKNIGASAQRKNKAVKKRQKNALGSYGMVRSVSPENSFKSRGDEARLKVPDHRNVIPWLLLYILFTLDEITLGCFEP